MATFYFNGAVDNNWQTLGNWWMDATFTTQATALPTSADDVFVDGSTGIYSNSGSQPTVANLTLTAPSPTSTAADIDIDITVTGMATFDANARFISRVLTGNATFNDYAENMGTVTGNATFNGSSSNSGTIDGNATFNDSAYNNTGTCDTAVYAATAAAFQLAGNYAGTVSGSCTVRIGINGSSILGLP